jgi:hypothetical protein
LQTLLFGLLEHAEQLGQRLGAKLCLLQKAKEPDLFDNLARPFTV